jgi:hypothetical protein
VAQLKQWTFLPSVNRSASADADGLRVDGFTRATIYLDITASSGTSPTLDVAVEVSPDGTSWHPLKVPPDITEAVVIAQWNTDGNDAVTFDFAAAWMRVSVTQAGTADRFTYTVKVDLMKMS